MPLSDADVDRILAEIKAGAEVNHNHSGGRYSDTFAWRNGGWFWESFEEGTTFGGAVDEAAMRNGIAQTPVEAFVFILGKR
jgi:hypothetical protein